MDNFFVVAVIVVIIAISLAKKIGKAMREVAEEQQRALKNKQPGGGPSALSQQQKKPDLQNLLEALARKAEAQGAVVKKPPQPEPQLRVKVPAPVEKARLEKTPEPDAYTLKAPEPDAYALEVPQSSRYNPWKSESVTKPKAPVPEEARSAEPEAAHGVAETDAYMLENGLVFGETPDIRTGGAGVEPSQALLGVLRGREFWQQAIVLREVLGAPRALRPLGRENTYGTWG